MGCYKPLKAFRSRRGPSSNGAWPIVFDTKNGYAHLTMDVPCGQCMGCRIDKAQQWAMRCVHESKQHEKNCFITLTYEKAPEGGSLNKFDIVNFFKRFREDIAPEKIRYLQCGEYGTLSGRPHHHAAIFGYDFPDKKFWKEKNGNKLYISDYLNGKWGHGYCVIGELTWESAAYIAAYVTKKITGPMAEKHYGGRIPEFITMSRRPGIGLEWWNKNKNDVLPDDRVLINGFLKKPPRYYDKKFDEENPEKMTERRIDRQFRLARAGRLEVSERSLDARREIVRQKHKAYGGHDL